MARKQKRWEWVLDHEGAQRVEVYDPREVALGAAGVIATDELQPVQAFAGVVHDELSVSVSTQERLKAQEFLDSVPDYVRTYDTPEGKLIDVGWREGYEEYPWRMRRVEVDVLLVVLCRYPTEPERAYL